LAFTLPRNAATRVLLFLTGALSLVLAILSFRHFGDGYAVLLLSLWIGNRFHLPGCFGECRSRWGERDLPGRGWYVVLGVMSLIAGAVVLVWPFDSIVVLTLVFRCVTDDPRCDPDRAGNPDPHGHQRRPQKRSTHYLRQVARRDDTTPAPPDRSDAATPIFARVETTMLQPEVHDFGVHDMNVTIRLNLLGWQVGHLQH